MPPLRITSSPPVILNFDGHSFFVRHSVSSTASIRYDEQSNAILVTEGGTVKSLPDPDRRERIGPCVYQGMTTALSASGDFSQSIQMKKDDRGVCQYSFEVPCDKKGVTVSWAMNDDQAKAREASRSAIFQYEEMGVAKTREMNRLLACKFLNFVAATQVRRDLLLPVVALYDVYINRKKDGRWRTIPNPRLITFWASQI